jgi:hypothetical protein
LTSVNKWIYQKSSKFHAREATDDTLWKIPPKITFQPMIPTNIIPID